MPSKGVCFDVTDLPVPPFTFEAGTRGPLKLKQALKRAPYQGEREFDAYQGLVLVIWQAE